MNKAKIITMLVTVFLILPLISWWIYEANQGDTFLLNLGRLLMIIFIWSIAITGFMWVVAHWNDLTPRETKGIILEDNPRPHIKVVYESFLVREGKEIHTTAEGYGRLHFYNDTDSTVEVFVSKNVNIQPASNEIREVSPTDC